MNQDLDQRSFIDDVLRRTGWSQSELAARAGIDPSTLSRFLTGSRHGHALRDTTLRKIEAVTGLAFGGGPSPDPMPAGMAEAEATPLSGDDRSPLAAIVAALSQGRRNIDPWRLNSRALEGAGYRPGDTLLVALDETPLAGDVVCAQIYDWASSKAETVFRLFQPPYLVAATSDPVLMRPHVVDGHQVQIRGVVTHSLRGRPSDRSS